jgi:hypothetical protein
VDWLAELRTWGPLAGGAVAGVVPWLKVLSDAKKARERREIDDVRQRVDLIKIAEEISAKALARLQSRVEALEAELTELRKEHAQTVAAKDAKIVLLEGYLRQALALAQSYEQKLSDAGIPHEKPRQPFWGIDAGSEPSELYEGRLP